MIRSHGKTLPATALVIALATPLSQGGVEFRHLQPEVFSATGALVNALADVDGDGDQEIFVGFNGTPNRLYWNNKGAFSEGAAAAGVADARATRSAAFGDYDSDGDDDLLLGFAPGPEPILKLYRNEGGKFSDATMDAGLGLDSAAVRQLVWVDFDADDDLDLFVALRDRPNRLYRNDSSKFIDIAAEVGLADTRRSVGATWADLDADGDLDVIVGNMDGDANGYFRNDGGKFTDIAKEAGLEWGGRAPAERTNGTVRPCAADVDSDGRFDLFFANYGPAGLFLAGEGGKWTDAGAAWGSAVDGRYDTCAFDDIDHDGRVDLYLNGTVTGGQNWPDYLYRNAGKRFEPVIPPILSAITADHGAQWGDLNGDGAADLVLAGQGPHAVLLSTLASSVAHRSVRVRVVDAKGFATRAGAEIRVYAAGTRGLLATALVDAGSGYNAQSDIPVHLGLPGLSRVDVEVTWPAAGERRVTVERNVRVDGRKVLTVLAP